MGKTSGPSSIPFVGLPLSFSFPTSFPFLDLGGSIQNVSSHFLGFPMPGPSWYVALTYFVPSSVGASTNIGVGSIAPLSMPPSGTTALIQGISHGLGSIPPPNPPQSSRNPIGGSNFVWGSNF